MKRTPLQRRTPLKRTGSFGQSARRAAERREYSAKVAAFLAAHPFCQISIFLRKLLEADIIAANGCYRDRSGVSHRIPRSEVVHHRNKRRGRRLLDERFWIAACNEEHSLLEDHKALSREIGLLLPFEADENGRLPNGMVCKTTDELLGNVEANVKL